MNRAGLASIVVVGLWACSDKPREREVPASAEPTASAKAPSAPTADASASPSASASTEAPRVAVLPPQPTSRTPIRDCAVSSEGDVAACCSEDGYEDVLRMVKNRSSADCEKIASLPGYSSCPTYFARGFHSAVASCFRQAMERELDRRLVPLKRVDAEAFRREMALQRSFNEALRATCNAILEKEPSTGDFGGEHACQRALLSLRTRQAVEVNDEGIRTTHPPASKVARAARFRGFAKELCALGRLWKESAPASCEGRVLGQLEDALADAAKP